MVDKIYVGTFQSEEQVLMRINKLRAQGFPENTIFIVTNNPDSLTTISHQTAVNIRYPEGSWFDQVKSFMAGNGPIRGAFRHMGFTREEALQYYNEVENGGILLFVNQHLKKRFNHQEVGVQSNYVNSNLNTNKSHLLDEELFENQKNS